MKITIEIEIESDVAVYDLSKHDVFQGIKEHLLNTYNDDDSIKGINLLLKGEIVE